jgi:SpoU rRNA methylase family enzyme
MAENQTESKKTTAKKGNKTTEIIIGAGASKLTTAVAALSSVVEVINQLPAKVQENVLLVSDLEDKIGVLQQDLKNKTAQNKIEIEQAYEADKEAFVSKWLNENGKTAVASEEYSEMQEKIANFEETLETTVAKEVGKAVGIEKNNSAQALKIKELEFEKKEADNKAEINQLKQQNAFLTQQAEQWKKMLETQIANETERSKHQPAIHVNGTNTGR